MAKKPNIAAKAPRPKTLVIPDKYAPILGTVLLAGLLFLFFLLRLHYKDMSYERDEGTYAYMGKLLLEGKKPYTYFYEMKPPGLFYMYAFMISIFGSSVTGLHIGFFIINILTSLAMFGWIRRMLNPTAGVLAAVAYSIISTSPHASGLTIQAEHLLCLFLLGGLWMLWEAFHANKSWMWILAGVLMSWSFLIKQNGAFFILFALVAIFLDHFMSGEKRKNSELVKSVSLFGIGGIIPVALMVGILAAQGSLKEFWFFIYEFPKQQYLTSIEFSRGMGYFQDRLGLIKSGYEWVWYTAGLGLILSWIFDSSLKRKILTTLLLILSVLSIAPGLRFYGHYWIHFLPAIAVLFAVAVNLATEWMASNKWINHPKTISLIVLFLVSILTINANKLYFFSADPEKVVRMVYGSNPFPESRKVGDFLNTVMKPDEKLMVLGSEPQIYMYTDKFCASRHFYCGNLVQKPEIVKTWAKEFKNDFTKNPPDYVVWVNHPFSWSIPQGGDTKFIDWAYKQIMISYHPIGWAEYISPNESKYTFDVKNAMNYKPSAKEYMIVLQKNSNVGL